MGGMRGWWLVVLAACHHGAAARPDAASPDAAVDAPIDAAIDAPPDARASIGAACGNDGECDSGHCVANVPAGTGGTCCATACTASDGCHVAQCATGACRDVAIASGQCVVTAAGDQLTACGAAALGCTAPADTDGDNLPDAWEASDNGAGVPYVDLDCDGRWSPASEPLLPGASPTLPDIYVTYDFMGYGLDEHTCTTDSNCTNRGGAGYHTGETCNASGQCQLTCTQTSDCTHVGDHCLAVANGGACPDTPGAPSGACACFHTHDPEVIAPGALQKVVDVFALHGFSVHIARGQERAHSHVVSLRSDAQMTIGCEGGSVAGSTAGVGKYAVSLYDLKSLAVGTRYFTHYALFAHYAGCDSIGHCPFDSPMTSNCPDSNFSFAQSGIAEIAGNDFIVSLGGQVNESGIAPGITSAAGFSLLGSVFMHELGHNLALRHDGHADHPCPGGSGCASDETCIDLSDGQGQVCHESVGGLLGAEEPNYKPNYISIMNYQYMRSGILNASTAGSSVPDPALTRLDYSNEALPTLHEDALVDADGLGWTADPLYPAAYMLFAYTDGTCHVCPQIAPASGAVDWQCVNCARNPSCQLIGTGPSVFDATVAADVDADAAVCALAPADTLTGHKDWGNFVYAFQCTPRAAN